MAIIIRNLKGDPLGLCEYEVRINDKRITTFKHNRPSGLRACLLAAAEAVEASAMAGCRPNHGHQRSVNVQKGEPMNQELEDAVEDYWGAAYYEGEYGLPTDDGKAQNALDRIRAGVGKLEARVAELEALLRRARAVIPPDEYEDEIEVRRAINQALNASA